MLPDLNGCEWNEFDLIIVGGERKGGGKEWEGSGEETRTGSQTWEVTRIVS